MAAMANHRTAFCRAAGVTDAARTLRSLCVLLALSVVGISSSAAQSSSIRRNSEPALRTDILLVFAGAFTTGNLGETLNPLYPHDGNYLVGLAYARDFANLNWGFNLGGEIGYAARFGNDRGSSELWIGPVLRH